MTTANWIQLVVSIGIVFALAPFLAKFMTRVFEGERHILSFLGPVERGIYRVSGIREDREMNWKQYLAALLIFNAFGFASLMALLMTQQWLPLNPAHIPNMSWHLALNTAVSFMTNTNWQAYNGEVSASYLSQMAGLAVHNFLSAATGMAAALALIRGHQESSVRPVRRKARPGGSWQFLGGSHPDHTVRASSPCRSS